MLTGFALPPRDVVRPRWDSVQLLSSGLRLDAMCYCGDGVILTATRTGSNGEAFRSIDHGETYTQVANIGEPVGALCFLDGYVFAVSISTTRVFRSADFGETWTNVSRLHSLSDPEFKCYSIMPTPAGALLALDRRDTGGSDKGHNQRSTDYGGTWADYGQVAGDFPYRSVLAANGRILMNGWDGKAYISDDDGISFIDAGTIDPAQANYGIGYLGNNVCASVRRDGTWYVSTENGDIGSWKEAFKLNGWCDIISATGFGEVMYSTYYEKITTYFSLNFGKRMKELGPVPTVPGDIFEFHINVPDAPEGSIIVGGTQQGYAARVIFDRLAA